MTTRTVEQTICDMCKKVVDDSNSVRVEVVTSYTPDPSGNNDTHKEYATEDLCHSCIAHMRSRMRAKR